MKIHWETYPISQRGDQEIGSAALLIDSTLHFLFTHHCDPFPREFRPPTIHHHPPTLHASRHLSTPHLKVVHVQLAWGETFLCWFLSLKYVNTFADCGSLCSLLCPCVRRRWGKSRENTEENHRKAEKQGPVQFHSCFRSISTRPFEW